MFIGGYEITTNDWLGRISLTIYMSGCNLRCRFCYNKGLLNARNGKYYSDKEIENIIINHQNLADNVVFTGGEPTLQPTDLKKACEIAKKRGYDVMLNTNGTNSDVIKDLLKNKLVDKVAMDVKTRLDNDAYFDLTSCGEVIRDIEETMLLCNIHQIPLEVRTTVVPTIIDGDIIKDIVDDIKHYADEYHLQEFMPKDVLDPKLNDLKSFSLEEMTNLGKIAKNNGAKYVIIMMKNGVYVI